MTPGQILILLIFALCDSVWEYDKAMELENLKKLLEEKEKGIEDMADKLSITKEELFAKVREVLELHMRINNSKEYTSSSSGEHKPFLNSSKK